MRLFTAWIGLWILVAIGLGGCEEEIPDVVERIRAIKTITLAEVASGQVRKYSGIIEATVSSTLSFQVSGRVQSVAVQLGDRVTEGQVLATIDTKPYELNIQAAEAELSKARAVLSEKQQQFNRRKTLFDKGWVAKAALEQAQVGLRSGQSQVNFAISQLNLAQRDLDNTKLAAPFDGVISERTIDAFVEVGAGRKVFEINAEGALEVAFDVPETSISRITLGMPASIVFAAENTCVCNARVTKIGTSAGDANAFPVKAALLDPPATVLPGMTAELTIVLEGDKGETAYLMPIAALVPEGNPPEGFVFVYDSETSTVRKTAVRLTTATNNMVGVMEGIKAGDVIAVAGVSFLKDGQKVKLMSP